MTKRTIEIDDNLDDTVKCVKEEVLNHFIDWLKDNNDCEDFDNYYQDSGCDAIHEIADSNTPIYYSDIDGLYYLYGSEFDEAYNNAGIGDGTEDNHRQVAIYCYLEEKAFDFHKEMTELFDSWVSEEPKRKLKEFIEELKELI